MNTEHRSATRLIGQSGLLLFGNAFTLLVGLPFQIYLANVLGAMQLGAFGLLEVTATTAGTLLGLGLSALPVRFIPQPVERREFGSARSLVAWTFGLALAAGAAGAIAMLMLGDVAVALAPELAPHRTLVPAAAAMTVFGMLIGLAAQVLRAFLDIRLIVLMSSVVQLTLKVVATIVFVGWGWGLAGYVWGVLVSLAVTTVGLGLSVRHHLRKLPAGGGPATAAQKREWLDFGRTLYASSLLGVFAAPAERYTLAHSLGLAGVGVLMVVRQLQSLGQILQNAFVAAASPLWVGAQARGERQEVQRLYDLATDAIGRLSFPLLVFLAVFADPVLRLFGEAFASDGALPLRIVLLGQAVNVLTGPHGALLNVLGLEKTLLRLYAVSTTMLLAGLLVLGTHFGLVGVAIAQLLPLLFLNAVELHLMKSRLGLSWHSHRHARLLGSTAISAGAALLAARVFPMPSAAGLVGVFLLCYVCFLLPYVVPRPAREDAEVFAAIRAQLGWRR